MRPVRLTDEPGGGSVRSELAGAEGFEISRAKLARCIGVALAGKASQGRVLNLLDSDLPIAGLFAESCSPG